MNFNNFERFKFGEETSIHHNIDMGVEVFFMGLVSV